MQNTNDSVKASWGTDLWDQYESLATHTQLGIEFCERFASFLKERCIIERDYAAKMKKLIKHYQPKKNEDTEFSYNKSFVLMVNELFDMAGQHDMIAENLNVVVMSELLRNIQDLKQDRKKYLNDGAKLISLLQSQIQALDKAKAQYDKSFKDSEKSKEIYQKSDANIQLSRADVEKARTTMMTKQQQCEHAKAAYASELQKTNRDQQQHYNFLMPDVFKNLQTMEENRINRVQEFIQKSADIETDVLSILNTCVLGIKKAASAVNANEDCILVVEKYKSGYVPPGDIPFVDQSCANINGSNPSPKTVRPTIRSNSTRGTRNRASSRKRSGVFNLFSNKQDEEDGGDYSHLPPNQQKKKLWEKIKIIKNQLAKTTAERDGLLKMQEVYRKDAKLGDPRSLNKQLEEVAQELDRLKQELNKYEDFLAKAESRNLQSESLSSSNSNVSISSAHQTTPNHSSVVTPTPETPVNNCVEVNRSNSSGGENRHSRTNSGAEQDSFEDHEDDDVAVSLGMCTAMYPFEAISDGAISMAAGEQFMIIERDQGDGWTRVRRTDGDDGFVPTSYIDCKYN